MWRLRVIQGPMHFPRVRAESARQIVGPLQAGSFVGTFRGLRMGHPRPAGHEPGETLRRGVGCLTQIRKTTLVPRASVNACFRGRTFLFCHLGFNAPTRQRATAGWARGSRFGQAAALESRDGLIRDRFLPGSERDRVVNPNGPVKQRAREFWAEDRPGAGWAALSGQERRTLTRRCVAVSRCQRGRKTQDAGSSHSRRLL